MAIRHLRQGLGDDVRLAWPVSDRGRSNKGDVGYIPQGYGHSLENAGTEPARLLLGFNTGHYEAIDLSSWIAGNPAYLLATNLGLDRPVVDQLPTDRVFIAPASGTPKPPEGRDRIR